MTKETTWVSLTQAIKDGAPIDWASLEKTFPRAMLTCHKGKDCCKVKGTLRTSGAKDTPLADIDGWVFSGPTEFGLSDLMHDGWNDSGWVLWVEGEIPLRPLTAADLPLGTCFLDLTRTPCVVVESHEGKKSVATFGFFFSQVRPAQDVKVLQVFGVGTFKKAEDEA